MSELALVEQHSIDVQQWSDVLVFAARFADAVADTEFVPGALRGRRDAVAALVVYGAEVGVTPMQALAGIHIVDGRPQPSAELMRAMILRAGHTLTFHEMGETRAVVSGLRRGEPERERRTVEWTLDQARRAGLTGRPNWQRYPRAMLMARATGDLARLKFADVVKGLGYVAEDEPEAIDGWAPDGEPVPETPARKPLQRRRRTPTTTPVSEATAPALEPVAAKSDAPVAPEPLEPEVDDNTTDRWLTDDEAEARWRAEVERQHAEVEARPSEPAPDEDIPLPDDMQPVGTGRPILPDLEPETPDDEPATPPGVVLIGARPLRALNAGLTRELGTAATREERHALVEAIVGHPIETTKTLRRADGYRALDYLDRFADGSATWAFRDPSDIRKGVVVTDLREPPDDAE